MITIIIITLPAGRPVWNNLFKFSHRHFNYNAYYNVHKLYIYPKKSYLQEKCYVIVGSSLMFIIFVVLKRCLVLCDV